MLSKDEQRFVDYWTANRLKEKKTFRQLLIGLPLGLTFALAIVAIFSSGWYERAQMAAYSNSSPFVFMAAVFGIIAFVAIFSKKHKWDMNEQRYTELLEREKREAANAANESHN